MTTGVIHDLGYQHYDGPRLGRPAIVRALAWHSLRSAFGLGRGARAKIVPVLVFVIMCLPAVVNAVTTAGGHGRLFPYDTYVFRLRALMMTIFVAAQAPELMSRDLRSHVLPLYLSRPLRRLDYPLAKFLAFTAACLLLIEIPLLLLYLGTIVNAGGWAAIWAQTRALFPGLLIGVLWAVLLAAGGLISPVTVLEGVRQWLGGTSPSPVPPPGSLGAVYGVMLLALLAASLGWLAVRYLRAGLS